MRTRWEWQCSSKWQSIHFVWSSAVFTLAFPEPFSGGYPTATITHYIECTHLSKFTTPIALMCLKIRTTKWSFYHRTFFENTELNSFYGKPLYRVDIPHYTDVIMGTIASQITSLTIVYSSVYSDADQRKYQNSASLAFVWGIRRGPVNSLHKWPVTPKMFPFDDVIMQLGHLQGCFEFCVWFSLLCLEPRINNLPHVCQSISFFLQIYYK